MPRRPVLSKYPHLHSILRNDPIANQQFNAAISGLNLPQADNEESELTKQNDALRKKIAEQEAKTAAAVKLLQKQEAFIKLLGESIEAQTDLEPYSSDISAGRRYTISFSPDQIRVALKMYWEAVSQDMEESLSKAATFAGSLVVSVD